MSVLVVIIFLGCFVNDIYCLSTPKIYINGTRPNGLEYVIDSNNNLSISCESAKPITWSFPNNTINGVTYSQVSSREEKRPGGYFTSLNLDNASYVDTGFYCCHEENSNCESGTDHEKIYLYVRDENVLSAVPYNDFDTIVVAQDQEAVIPCRPNSPDVEVRLFRNALDDEVLGVEFDRKYGFKFVALISHVDDYICTFERDGLHGRLDIFLFVKSKIDYIPLPEVVDAKQNHTVVGEKLMLRCSLNFKHPFKMTWIPPNLKATREKRLKEGEVVMGSDTNYSDLTVNNATKEDEGEYTCKVSGGSNESSNAITVKIFGKTEHFIKLFEENDLYTISVNAGENAIYHVNIQTHPIEKFSANWYDNKKELIINNDKFDVKSNPTDSILKIRGVTITDYGNYTLVAKNAYEESKLTLFLNITDKPSVHIKTAEFHLFDNISEVKCIAAAQPEPDIQWEWKPCLDTTCDYTILEEESHHMEGMQKVSSLKMKAEKPGQLRCSARNDLGDDFAVSTFSITDVKDGFDKWISDNVNEIPNTSQYKVAVGDVLEMTCAASLHGNGKITWTKSDKPFITDGDHILEYSYTDYSNRTKLVINDVKSNDSGRYTCKVSEKGKAIKVQIVDIEAEEPTLPTINKSNLKDTAIDFPFPIEMTCYFFGLPRPKISWLKNGHPFHFHDGIIVSENEQKIRFERTAAADEGVYTCKVSNRIGTVKREMRLTFKNKESILYILIIIPVLIVILLILLLCLCLKIRKERLLQKELKAIGLASFETGQVDSINPDLELGDQADLLPYDKKWEFPKEKLKLGRQLGAGAFGVVKKAEARGIVDDEETTTVAVKMVKPTAEHDLIRALASELKIMVHLGKHLNVVNLLGACTKSIAKRELYVIVEYCRYGNLNNYLMRHRENFIDQIDRNTGIINFSIGYDSQNRSYSFSEYRNGQDNSLMADYRGDNYTGQTANTETTLVSMSPTGDAEDSIIMSNGSSQPDWRSNYKGDYKDNVQPILTADLITWAFQVARGMEYLASRKVLHGDLAARNILLSDNNIVKICDFGLAKNMYKSDNYKKKNNSLLPIKWMAIESMEDATFSTQSDIWSYGIVLWEFFSLSKAPYPGIESYEELYKKLFSGFRMEQPRYATKELYQVMFDCWHAEPMRRPTFTALVDRMGRMLNESVKQHYIDLNDPYLQINTSRMDDYLAMFSPPDFQSQSSPRSFGNGSIPPGNASGYMCMKPGDVFSPRLRSSESVFVFDVAGEKRDGAAATASPIELKPMLANGHPASSFSNPSYHLLPKALHELPKNNYVNVPIARSDVGKDYVKDATRDWEGNVDNDLIFEDATLS